MMDPSNTLSDPHLEASTTLSLKREPACFAFLCSRAVSAPLPIDAINLDLTSVDYFRGRASLWATLEVRSGFIKEQPTAVLGFDESFLQPFTRALIQAATSRERFRMTILHEADGTLRQRVVEYVTGAGAMLRELVITPHDTVLDVAGRSGADSDEEIHFQLPRSDAFLRAFAEMAYKADQALRDTLRESETLARRRSASLATRGCANDARAFDIEAWLRDYDAERPHSSLGWLTPLAYAACLQSPSSQRDRTLPLSGGSTSCLVASAAESGFTDPRTLASTG